MYLAAGSAETQMLSRVFGKKVGGTRPVPKGLLGLGDFGVGFSSPIVIAGGLAVLYIGYKLLKGK